MRQLVRVMVDRLTRVFFRYFFSGLLFVISSAQWVCIAWVLSSFQPLDWPLWAHALAAIGIYSLNRGIVRRRSGTIRIPAPLVRAYSASAFISLFCFLFLVVTGAMWLIAEYMLGAWRALAVTAVPAAGEADWNGTFRLVASTGMAGIALLFSYGYVYGQRRLRLSRIRVPMRGWASNAPPIRIAHISDIHVGHNLTLTELRRFVDRVNALDPDLICITGDIADSPSSDYARFFPLLGELRARRGVFAILGNHDHYAGAQDVVAALRRWTPFHVLRDSATTVRVDSVDLHIIGLDDRGRDWARGVLSDPCLTDLLAQAPPQTPIMLLSHRPDIFPEAAAAGVGLTLAGHTHGGQLALPGFGRRPRNLADFITDFSRGLYERDGCSLYVTCGLGVTAQRIRLCTPREIALIELRPQEARSERTLRTESWPRGSGDEAHEAGV